MRTGNTVSRGRAPRSGNGYATDVTVDRPPERPRGAAAWVGGALLRASVLFTLVALELVFGTSGVLVGLVALGGIFAWRSFYKSREAATAEGHDAVLLTFRVNDHLVGDGVVEPDGARAWPWLVRGGLLVLVGLAVLVAGAIYLPAGFVFLGLTPILAGLEHLGHGLALQGSGAAPAGFEVRSAGAEFVLRGASGEAHVGKAPAHLREGRVEVGARVVRRFRLPRWVFEQSAIILPLVITAVSVLAMQLAFLLSVITGIAGGGESGPPEPSAEYLQRLLTGDKAGKEQGYLTLERSTTPSDTKIESYYLPAGSTGPVTEIGGGARVGPRERSADPRPRKAEPEASIKIEDLGKTEELTPTEAPETDGIAELADPLATPDGEQADQPQSVEVKEGWGLTDWYDTEDARRDAQEIQRELDLSRELLRLDPDNLFGLSIKAYYEYLAMDFDAAKATYDRMIQLDGTSGAEWNNLALVYKRLGDYQKEEELYRTSLMFDPDEPNTYVNLALCVAHQGRFDEALQIMKRLEREIPDDPYADLHRAKIYALMGKEEESYTYLRKSLKTMRKLDTLHNIEFQQDIRVDPAFATMRETPRFKRLLMRYYGERPGGWWILGKGEGDAAPDPE